MKEKGRGKKSNHSQTVRRMRGKKQETRVDHADGKAYPLDSFLEVYGEDEGRCRWATAGQQRAYTGIFMMHVHV